MITEIKIPSPGESILEVEISSILVKNGDYVNKGQIIAEIDSDKATLEISSEEEGIIKLLVKEGDKVNVGDTFCIIKHYNNIKKIIRKEKNKKEKKNNKIFASPSAKKIIREKSISVEKIKGTGKNGMITKKDCIKHYIEKNDIKNQYSEYYDKKEERKEIIIPLSSLRRKLSERLVSIKNKTAMLTTFNEVNMKEVILLRNKYKEIFKKKHGIKLGFMSFFTTACVKSLKKYPDVNSIIYNEKKISYNYVDISIAISGPKGLMVPVIKNANKLLSFDKIEKEINRLSNKVHNGTISIEDMKGGTFTITNGGIFGSMLSTPIINPPQSAILGMHKITERPTVVNNSIKICPIMYLALSYDHRIIDGKESVGFLSYIKNLIENPIKLLMENNVLKILNL
ncbi:2-oxoglutarate dehydrogenase complex dihydrolipoyllysine-residue succinyltransferase [Blattabacterium cuenoti]|uniref:2-oxoglutarate dehydrogenase complex dihydrolipoyllysine-residue succinyltransferase n=1 Tax=Blattabacterium cuenoti TaxID=1653831 RepID=UPI00163B7A81|nr:2-oxoglutarate dehydrogenase complex dihydrolipoyllysine-residue succinyltransferase [Blattabacterium cuenoti]